MAKGIRYAGVGQEKARFRRWLVFLLLVLGALSVLLTYQAYRQIRWEAFYQHKVMAEEWLVRLGQSAADMVRAEEGRSFADYAFLKVQGDAENNVLQRSPLSEYPVVSQIPGAIGYFQVDSSGQLTSPLYDAETELRAFGISEAEREQRLAAFQEIQKILRGNRLLEADGGQFVLPSAPAPSTGLRSRRGERDADKLETLEEGLPTAADSAVAGESESGFDRLNTPEDSDASITTKALVEWTICLNSRKDLMTGLRQQAAEAPSSRGAKLLNEAPRAKRLEQSAAVQSKDELRRQLAQNAYGNVPIQTFESEVDPFDWSLLNTGHFVLFRKVWRDEQRFVQGLLIDSDTFLNEVVLASYRSTALSDMSELLVVFNSNVLAVAQGGTASAGYLSSVGGVQGTLLHRQFLPSPLSATELILTIDQLPIGAAGRVLLLTAGILALGLLSGFWFIYRLGSQQIEVAQQQRDFVSSVSHELKTPLTSIRMYGEMLKAGWASEEKKNEYYDYIHDESERLSRLIENVLQMARLSKGQLNLSLESVPAVRLLDNLESKLSSQTESAGFELDIERHDNIRNSVLHVDKDAFMQIFINLVDNAIKFSSQSEHKTVKLSAKQRTDASLEIIIRDYGPGIPKAQLRKIFTEFYRLEDEMTRSTAGTGIGLALVHQLVSAMNGSVDVINSDPGASFVVRFPQIGSG